MHISNTYPSVPDTCLVGRTIFRLSVLALLLLSALGFAQPTTLSGTINIYTPAIFIDTTSCLDKVAVASSAGFAVGDSVLIIQMKGAAIDTSNSAAFGSITNNGLMGAGKYEVAAITAIVGNTLVLNGNLVNQYYIAGFVQVIRIPSYVNANIVGILSCPPWNGSTGGVLIFSVQNVLTFNGDIILRGRGFRGGLIHNNPDGGCGGGSPDYYYDLFQGGFSWVSGGAEKGEGIGSVASTKRAGKGPLGNGGGGGNKHNTGGGGGSNYTSGGKGGNELGGCTGGNGGLGGINLAGYYAASHLFLGGGGGCGDDNNNSGTTGENGGGLVIITAGSIIGNNQQINVDGNSVLPVAAGALDGAGGGGGGGTIFIKANSVSNLTVTAAGGSGGNQNGSGCAGPGGGGGAGITLTSMLSLTGISTFMTPGPAGSFLNASCGGIGSTYSATAGAPNPALGLTGIPLIHTPNSVAATLSANSSSTACSGQSLQLTAPGGWAAYSWTGPLLFSSSLQNPVINPATPANSGNYVLTVTSGGGCTASGITSVTINQVPTPSITITNACQGQTMSGNASIGFFPGASFSWSGPNGFSSSNAGFTLPGASPAMSGAYTLTVALNGCTTTASANVQVISVPVPTVSLNSPVCAGSSLSLTASSVSGMLYSWTGPGLYTSTLQNPVINPATPAYNGVFTLSGLLSGCTATAATIPATIYPAPPVTVTSNSVCSGQTLFVNSAAPTATSYSWQGPNGFSAATPGFNFANASASVSGVYTLMVTDAQSCTSTLSASVLVVAMPTASLAANAPVCEGSVLNFMTLGGNAHLLSGPNGYFSTAPNPSIINVQLAASGNYSLVTSVSSCSSAAAIVPVNILPRPSPTVSNTGPVCAPTGFQLTAIGGASYAWSGPNGFSSQQSATQIAVSTPGDSGTYSVIVTGSNGCQALGLTPVVVNPLPVAIATGTTACLGQPALLLAGGGNAYSWSGPGGYAALSQNALIPVAQTGSAGTYTVIVMGAGSCTAGATANLGISPVPSPSVSATARACVNSSITLQGSGGLSYQWNGPAGFSGHEPQVIFAAQHTGNAGTYTLTATNVFGCSASATINVIVDDLPYASLSGISGACVPFCSDFSLMPSAGSSIAGANLQFDGISLPGTNFSRCFYRAGSHPVVATFTSQQGCINSATFAIRAYPLPVANFEYLPQEPAENFEPVIFTNTSEGYNPYLCKWYVDDDHFHTADSKDLSYLFENAGTYVVALVVKNDLGCKDTLVQKVVIGEEFNLYVPSAFTPNEDGKNETFQPKGKGIVSYQLVIYDRWGEQVFKTTRFDEGWDGTFRGEPCKSDVYVWKIQAVNSSGKKKDLYGHVTLYK